MAASPKVSVILTTYNRAPLLQRAIDSLLAQDWQDWELIIVDDGSTDDTATVLAPYADPRFRIIRHPENRGVNAAKNTGFDAIRGEWFTFLDSDDEMIGTDALSTMLSVPERIDPTIDAVTCNCIDMSTGQFAGFGLDRDQYLEWRTILQRCRGEFWGITKTALLGADRFHDGMRGFEDFLWYQIDKRARRYYIHRALRIWHTEGDDRLCKEKVDHALQRTSIYRSSCALLEEQEFLNDLRQYGRDKFIGIMYRSALSFIENKDRWRALRALRSIIPYPSAARRSAIVLTGVVFGPDTLRSLRRLGKSEASA